MQSNVKLAFAGGGNMAQAMISGLVAHGCSAARLRVADPDSQKLQEIFHRFGVSIFEENRAAVSPANVVVLAVKPGLVPTVLEEISPVLAPDALVISIAAGVTLATLQRHLPAKQPVVRAMPNTPALVGEGITVMIPAATCDSAKAETARNVLESMGEVVEIDNESLMDGVTALSGSGPAYVYLMLEALSDGGVACGLPRTLADKLAVKTMLGSAKLVQESGKHPAILKNQVTSPAGTTIAALLELEKAGLRGTLMQAVMAAWQRSRQLGAS
ncbi:MAG: pyrroline-5-carboxylate reductase [Magnetococcales bacterium]|nr:pyrroline-5-carboxylate reductase [Magnetococcales bacterium]NGZ26454.1 pyrroline-5-carboxylate reductase [Magnetococcales bacterium]